MLYLAREAVSALVIVTSDLVLRVVIQLVHPTR